MLVWMSGCRRLCLGVKYDRWVWRTNRAGMQSSESTQKEEEEKQEEVVNVLLVVAGNLRRGVGAMYSSLVPFGGLWRPGCYTVSSDVRYVEAPDAMSLLSRA